MKHAKTVKISALLLASGAVAIGLLVYGNRESEDDVHLWPPSGAERVGQHAESDPVVADRADAHVQTTRPLLRFAPLIAEKSSELKARRLLISLRVRYARADPRFLDPKTSPFLDHPAGQVIDLELFDDTRLPLVLLDSEVLGSGVQLIKGRIQGFPESRFTMTVSDGGASLSIERSPEERFLVDAIGDGIYEIQEVDLERVPPCLGPLHMFLDADVLAAQGQGGSENVSDSRRTGRASSPEGDGLIDLLVVYSSDMAAAHTSTAIRNKTELAVAEANGDFVRSGSRVRLRLVGLKAVEYTENGSNSKALERLRRTADDFLDEVHGIRDEVGADVVCLLQERNDSGNSGIAYVMTKLSDLYNERYGFSVVEYRYLTGLNTLVHEIAHNLGCQHNLENASSEGLFPYSYGHRIRTPSGTTVYRTIMAYRPGSRISYFSTPDLTYGPSDYPVGVEDAADNVRSLNQAAFEVSNYRLAESDRDPTARIINVSTRATVGAGDRVLIGGFAVGGAAAGKEVLVRALGPSLGAYGVRDPLAALKVTLFQDGMILAENSGWRTGSDWEGVLATGFAPKSDREPAVLVTVQPGLYTAVVEGIDGAQGVSLIEVYDTGDTGPHLINLSTRGFVGTDDDVLIGGFVIGGEAGLTKRILIRTLGPSLVDYGVSNALYDPAMTLYDESGISLLENDDWDAGNQQEAIADLGLAPANRRESAMLLDLSPGLYTIVVRPFENTDGQEPGVGLIEAFEIKGE